MLIALIIGVFHLRPASIRLCKRQGQHVEEFMVKTLADEDEQLWNEHGLLRELWKPKKILHVWILLDGLDGLRVAQIFHVLYNQSAHNHAGGLVAGTIVDILQTLVVFFLYFVPW